MSFNFSKALFHVGNPLDAKPHHDLSLIEKFIKKNPDFALIIVLQNEDERKILEEKMKTMKLPEFHPGGFLMVWDDDEALMDMFCQDMHFCQVWNAIGPMWYECENKHISGATLEDRREECPECKAKLNPIELCKERGDKFGKILESAVKLMKFDNRSAKILSQQVNTTANVMQNLPVAIGLPEMPALRMEDWAGKGKGKTAFVVSAGP